jgi:MFS family permease
MVITGITFLAFALLPANFDYVPFAIILFIMGVGQGIFFSPNMASIMNSVPPEHRGVASVCAPPCRTADKPSAKPYSSQ